MRTIDEIFFDIENISVLCKVLANSLDECECYKISNEDFSCCLNHLSNSIEKLLNEMSDCLEFNLMN